MVLTKDKTQNTGPKARVNLMTKAVVIIVVQTIHLRNVQPMVKCAILVTKRGILSCIVDTDKEARAKENGSQGSPDVINMR